MQRNTWFIAAAVVAAVAVVVFGVVLGQRERGGMDHAAMGHGGGHDMSPIDASRAPRAPADLRPGQDLASTTVEGVREFALEVAAVQWPILPNLYAGAYAYNGQVPGPTIRVKPGEPIRIKVTNRLREPTTIHWHGLDIPADQDGVPFLSQPPIAPGATFTYAFVVPRTPGTFFYHSHFSADRQQAVGLYGVLLIEDTPPAIAAYTIALGEWRVVDGKSYPAMNGEGMMPTHFTFNGKSYPATETIKARVGDRILFRLVGSGQFVHPIHIHGGPFEIVATDGYPVPPAARLKKDTVLVGPGERYDVVWTALRPGKWLLHCHINHHTTNDGVEVDGGGGMMQVIDVAG
jgi:FtsP/CotA-like multicopper oxidase with cupredoxin domain